MAEAAPYYSWSIHLLYWIGGVAATVAGARVTSKIRDYQDARNYHREELKEHILRPMRTQIEELQLLPMFSVEWFQKHRNPNASALEPPVTYGPVLSMNASNQNLGNPTELALFEDARVNYYPKLITSWNKLKGSWFVHLDRRMKWIEEIAEAILGASGLEAHPTKDVNAPYVMHLALAMFVYNRLIGSGDGVLSVQTESSVAFLSDGGQRLAMGQTGQIAHIVQLTDSLIQFHKVRAAQLHEELTKMISDRSSLSNQFSFAIAEKKLSHHCGLVPFF
jgi:hypothetical protein